MWIFLSVSLLYNFSRKNRGIFVATIDLVFSYGSTKGRLYDEIYNNFRVEASVYLFHTLVMIFMIDIAAWRYPRTATSRRMKLLAVALRVTTRVGLRSTSFGWSSLGRAERRRTGNNERIYRPLTVLYQFSIVENIRDVTLLYFLFACEREREKESTGSRNKFPIIACLWLSICIFRLPHNKCVTNRLVTSRNVSSRQFICWQSRINKYILRDNLFSYIARATCVLFYVSYLFTEDLFHSNREICRFFSIFLSSILLTRRDLPTRAFILSYRGDVNC